MKKQSKSNVKAIVTDKAHLVEWQVFNISFYSFLLHQYIIFKAVNTFGAIDIFVVQSSLFYVYFDK